MDAPRESPGPSTENRFQLWFRYNWDQAVVPAIFVVMVLTFYVLNPNYLSPVNIVNVLNQVSILAIVTVGATVVILAGGFDLSAGSVVALSAVAGAVVVGDTGSVSLGVLVGIVVGTLVGVGNGIVAGHFGVSPLIVTLGTLNIARGGALIAAAGTAIYSFPVSYTDFGTSRFLGVPVLAIIAFVVFIVMHVVLKHTPFGLNVYAVGGNPTAARLSGINVAWVKMMTFAISGATAGLAGMLLAARTGGGEPTAGHFYELEAIAAVILGGAALHGGEGRLWRSMMGILLLSALGNGLNIIGVHPHWKGVAIGAILIGAASLDAIKRRVR
ncbi:MAG: ABC transporter permease [Rhodospirillales bacterium]|jgi:ribose transport system permease protein|nr:ABC transporter permease [Rhodospirillales bacterium]HJO73149.1 ABC transporter permease [Rhodospirillales bacterium]